MAPYKQRDFNSKQPGVAAYVLTKVKELSYHNVGTRIQRLSELTAPNHALAESLDRDMQRAAIHAAKQAKSGYRTAWSPTFAPAWANIHYHKMIHSAMATKTPDYHRVTADYNRGSIVRISHRTQRTQRGPTTRF
jgi:hypothetical protein